MSILGPDLKIKFLGNVPAAVYSYKYPKPIQKNSGFDGGKIFFFKSQLFTGQLDAKLLADNGVKDFLWLDRTELADLMLQEKQSRYWNAINSSLLPEGLGDKFTCKILNTVRKRLKNDIDVREAVSIK